MKQCWNQKARWMAVAMGLFCGGVRVMQGGEPTAMPPVPPGFERPLVIDRKLERDVQALEKKVAALEEQVAALEKRLRALEAKQRP